MTRHSPIIFNWLSPNIDPKAVLFRFYSPFQRHSPFLTARFPRITGKTTDFLAPKAYLNPYWSTFFATKPSHILWEAIVLVRNPLTFCESLLSGDETFSHFVRAYRTTFKWWLRPKTRKNTVNNGQMRCLRGILAVIMTWSRGYWGIIVGNMR